MKRFFSLLLTCIMIFNIGIVVKAETLTGNYTYIDSAYSPELNKYVVLAKDTTSSTMPAKLFVSDDCIEFKNTLSVSNAINYGAKNTRQLLVWWESEGVFAAQLGGTLYISQDGENWTKPALDASTNFYTSIATDGERLLIGARNHMYIADSYDQTARDKTISSNSNYYVKNVAIKPNSNIMYGIDGGNGNTYMYKIEDKGEEIESTEFIRNTGGSNAVDTFYIPEVDKWFVVNLQNVLLFLDETNTFTKVTPKTEDGDITEVITGAGSGEKYTIIGTKTGKLYYAKNDSVTNGETIWNPVENPQDAIEASEKIMDVTKGYEDFMLVLSEKNTYVLKETDSGVEYANTDKTYVEKDADRIESPNSGSESQTVSVSAKNYIGNEVEIKNVEMTETGDGVSALWNGSSLELLIDQDADVTKTFEVTDQYDRKTDFDISFVKEEGVALDGYESAVLPGEGEEALELPYTPYVIASDGKKMNRSASISVVSAPEGVEYDSERSVVVISSGGNGGDLILKVTSDTKPENYQEFVIPISPRVPSSIDMEVSDDTLTIPESGNVSIECSAMVKDQIKINMPSEKIKWSVSGNTTGISISQNGTVTVNEKAIKGDIKVKAESVTNSSVFAESTITLLWTDNRSVSEDLALIENEITTGIDLDFLSEGKYGTTLEWVSADKNIISDEGKIYRDRKNDTTVNVNVTCKKNKASSSKNIKITVLKAENFASVGDFEDNNAEGLNGEIVTDNVHEGNYAFKPAGNLTFEISAEKDSVYVFEAYVKSDSSVSLSTSEAGTLISVSPAGKYKRIAESYLYSADKKNEEIKFSSTGDWYIDDIRVYDITPEYKAVMEKITAAEYSKKSSDITAAENALKEFFDIPLKDRLSERVSNIKPNTSGGTGGSGGGSGGSSGKNTFVPPSSNTNPTVPNSSETVDNDEKVYENNLIFKDLSKHWAKDDIEFMAENGIVNGVDDTTFKPEENITRAEFTKLIVKTMGLSEKDYANTYYDIMSEDWYSGFVQTATDEGYISGFDGLFRPNDCITREEIAKVIVSAYNSKMNKSLEVGGAMYYSDFENVSPWAYDYIVAASNEGFINGISETEFAPKQNATRAQAVVMLKRLYDKING